MTSNHTDQTSWTQLTDLAKEAFERQLKLGREYAELARSSMAGEGDRTALGRAYLTAVRRESEHYWREMSTLGVGYAADVAALGIRVGSAVARDMRSAMAGHSHTAGPQARTAPSGSSAASAAPNGGTSAPSADVALHAPAGQIATATVTVANKHPRARRISLSAGPIHDDAGTELDARVTIVPRQVTVPAGEEEAILLSLAITAEDFALGSAYRCVVEITGGEEATVSVLISRDPA